MDLSIITLAALAVALWVVGMIGGFLVAWGLLTVYLTKTSNRQTLMGDADNADKKDVRLRKKTWTPRPFGVDFRPSPENPATPTDAPPKGETSRKAG